MNKPIENIDAEQVEAEEFHARMVAADAEIEQEMARERQAKHMARVELRRTQVAKLYLQGMGIKQITRELNVPYLTINNDLVSIREEWRAARVGFFDRAKTEQLEKLDQVEIEASEAWERSKQPTRITTTTEDDDGKVTVRVERRESVGDSQFLKTRTECIAQRRKLLGLDAPVKTESNVTAAITHYQPPDSREVVAEKIRDAVNRLRQPSVN